MPDTLKTEKDKPIMETGGEQDELADDDESSKFEDIVRKENEQVKDPEVSNDTPKEKKQPKKLEAK